jgi:hypothetical protein
MHMMEQQRCLGSDIYREQELQSFRKNELSCGKVSVCIDLRLNARIFDQIPVVDQKANAIVTPEQQYERLGVRKTSLLLKSSVPSTRPTKSSSNNFISTWK